MGIMISMKYTLSAFLLRTLSWITAAILLLIGFHGAFSMELSLKENLLNPVFCFALCASVLIIILLLLTRSSSLRPAYVDRMSGEQFERYCRSYFRLHGYYRIRTTQKTRDYGADLIMHKGLHKVVVQAKRYDHNIGVFAIQQALAAKAYYNADTAMVITNQYFTSSAIRLAEVNDVKLFDRSSLFKGA